MRRDAFKSLWTVAGTVVILGACFVLNYSFLFKAHPRVAASDPVDVPQRNPTSPEYLPSDNESSGSVDRPQLSGGDEIGELTRKSDEQTPQTAEAVPSAHDAEQRSLINYTRTPNSLTSWTPPELPEHLRTAHQTDPELIAHIRDFWILPPFEGPISLPPDELPTPGDQRKDKSEQGQPTLVNRILNNRTTGFFVECGAADGTFNSNSLLFETYHRWDGLLIEANPRLFESVLDKKRRAFMLNACLSVAETPAVVHFTSGGIAGGITEYISPGQWDYIESTYADREDVAVQCFPLYSILAALGVRHVDYLSLDIEGPEVEVLRTLPFDELVIDVMSIEKRVWEDVNATKQKIEDIKSLLLPYGYHVVDILELDIILSRV